MTKRRYNLTLAGLAVALVVVVSATVLTFGYPAKTSAKTHSTTQVETTQEVEKEAVAEITVPANTTQKNDARVYISAGEDEELISSEDIMEPGDLISTLIKIFSAK